jgi:hypothetical protein
LVSCPEDEGVQETAAKENITNFGEYKLNAKCVLVSLFKIYFLKLHGLEKRAAMEWEKGFANQHHQIQLVTYCLLYIRLPKTPSRYTFTLKMVTAMFAETLDSSLYSTWLITESRI